MPRSRSTRTCAPRESTYSCNDCGMWPSPIKKRSPPETASFRVGSVRCRSWRTSRERSVRSLSASRPGPFGYPVYDLAYFLLLEPLDAAPHVLNRAILHAHLDGRRAMHAPSQHFAQYLGPDL